LQYIAVTCCNTIVFVLEKHIGSKKTTAAAATAANKKTLSRVANWERVGVRAAP